MFFEILVLAILAILLLMKLSGSLNIPSWRTIKLINQLPGPTEYPFYIGVVSEIARMEMSDMIPWMKSLADKYGGIVAFYGFGSPVVMVNEPDYIELLMTSSKNIEKGADYKILTPWLKEGLVMSGGAKWKQRRKMLTPSFHFKILDGNVDCMNRNWRKVAERFLKSNGAPIEPLNIMGRGALDIICEAAMGTMLDKDAGGEEYVEAVKRVTFQAAKRSMTPFLRSDLIFNLTPIGRQHKKDVEILHSFTEKVIRERAEAFKERKHSEKNEYSDEGKKQNAFLDSILELAETMGLSESDLQEEVDTFMFAGHDTTSTALQFVFLRLAENPDIQEKAYQEQIDIFGYNDRDVTKDDLNKMHYLDQILKETLRLHPPAPQVGRETVEDIILPDGRVIPASVKIFVNFFLIHRNPKYFPDPEKFDPDRFTLEASKGRHPYCYLPFSAGPRNCIGQKFAMMEMKIAMSVILRSCKIKPLTRSSDLKYEMHIVLHPKPAIKIEVEPRNV